MCNGIIFPAVIDAGAAVSVISPLTLLGLPLQEFSGPSVLMVNGQKAPSFMPLISAIMVTRLLL